MRNVLSFDAGGMQAWGDHVAQGAGFGAVGEMRVAPAAGSLVKVLRWQPLHAIAVSGFYLREPSIRAPLKGDSAVYCTLTAQVSNLRLSQGASSLSLSTATVCVTHQPQMAAYVLHGAWDMQVNLVRCSLRRLPL